MSERDYSWGVGGKYDGPIESLTAELADARAEIKTMARALRVIRTWASIADLCDRALAPTESEVGDE